MVSSTFHRQGAQYVLYHFLRNSGQRAFNLYYVRVVSKILNSPLGGAKWVGGAWEVQNNMNKWSTGLSNHKHSRGVEKI